MVKPLNILVFSEDFPPYPGGIAQWAQGVAGGLSGLGHKVLVITRKREKYKPVEMTDSGYAVQTIQGRKWKQLRTWYCYQAVKSLYATDFRPDWIFATTWNFSRGIVRLTRKRKSRLVTVAHGLEVTRSMPAFKRGWMTKTLGQSDFVVSVSEFTRDRVLAISGIPESKVLVFPNGVDASRFRPGLEVKHLRVRLGLGGAKVILTLARVVERKGHDAVIRALPKVLQSVPNVKYLICGAWDKSYHLKLQRLIQSDGLQNHVLFTGYVAPAEAAAFYNLCDVFVMPSRELSAKGDTEGFGITFLEANACGKPVIGGRSGGVADAVADGKTGFLVDPENPDEIADRLILLLTRADLARKLGRQGRERILRSFTWETISKRMFDELNAAVRP
jgi:phosphatidylinositol alpha-1,6-mannosyltransferase